MNDDVIYWGLSNWQCSTSLLINHGFKIISILSNMHILGLILWKTFHSKQIPKQICVSYNTVCVFKQTERTSIRRGTLLTDVVADPFTAADTSQLWVACKHIAVLPFKETREKEENTSNH